MRLNLFCLFIFLCGAPAYAGWVKQNDVLSVNTRVASEIAAHLPSFPATLNGLNAENLASSTKVTVQNLAGSIAEYRWVNDGACKVPDSAAVQPIQLKQSSAMYVYASDPQDAWVRGDAEIIIGTPCDRVSLKSSFSKKK